MLKIKPDNYKRLKIMYRKKCAFAKWQVVSGEYQIDLRRNATKHI